MGVGSNNYSDNVFINCPFDDKYKNLLRPMLFTILYLGLVPKIAYERSDSAELRLIKIFELLSESQWSVHDISRILPDHSGDYPRLNMAFELGIDFGVREFGASNHHLKRQLVLAENSHDFKRALSDLSGSDITPHNNEPGEIVRAVRDWFYINAGMKKAPPPNKIWYKFADFSNYLFEDRKSKGGSDHDVSEDVERMSVPEFIDKVNNWISNFSNN
ncbi:MAG: hypothetical protein ACTSQ8_24625 [Candidatus Helarchaeota archaeon]